MGDLDLSLEELDMELNILFGRVLVVKIELDNVSALIEEVRVKRDRVAAARGEVSCA